MEAKIRKITLPGRDAHAIMTHKSRHEELKNLDFSTLDAKVAAVMVLLYPNPKNKVNIVLIRRNKYPGVHSNQIGLPGGGLERQDKNTEYTALRETEEEIGVPLKQIKVLKKLTPLFIPPSNFLVNPYLGICNYIPNFIKQETEVEEVIEVELSDLLAEECIQLKEVSSAYMPPTKVSCFYLKNQVVWGATAMILSELKQLMKKVEIA